MGGLFSLSSFGLLMFYSVRLAVVAGALVLALVAASLLLGRLQMRHHREALKMQGVFTHRSTGTYLERAGPSLVNELPSVALTRRFLSECEHHGSQRLAVRLVAIGRSAGVPGLPANDDTRLRNV